jgi:flagellar biosynthetic protein FlhB
MSKSDKTEPATPKKKRESRQKGEVAKSADLTGWAALLVALYILPAMVGRLATATGNVLVRTNDLSGVVDPDIAVEILGSTLLDGFLAAAPVMFVVVAVSILASLGQTGLLLAGKALKPNFKRIDPKSGFQRLFSVRSLWETVKQIIKFAVILGIMWPSVTNLVTTLTGQGRLVFIDSLTEVGNSVLGLCRSVTWTVLVLSVADYGYQRFQHNKDQRMTKQEVRDEYKNAEGDGSVKARMRSMQRSNARNRMLADMGMADVVITNPTHIAVALRYDPERGGAPRVIASGAGSMAAKIRERATEAKVPIVEAKPLARALWRSCEVGDEVPAALYEAIALVLVFVKRLDRRYSTGRALELPRTSRVADEYLAGVTGRRHRIA